MKEDDFDFNTYSKTKLSEEEEAKILKDMHAFIEDCINEKRKMYYSLPNDESKINWLKKAVVNCEALNILLGEFIVPLENSIPVHEGEEFADGELAKLIAPHIQHVSFHMTHHIVALYLMKTFCEKTKREKEEIEKLKEMMR